VKLGVADAAGVADWVAVMLPVGEAVLLALGESVAVGELLEVAVGE
jgi:hypothetical protein